MAVQDFFEWARSARSFDALAMYGGTSRVVGERGDRVRGESVSWQFFRVFREDPVLGRMFRPELSPHRFERTPGQNARLEPWS